MFEHAFDDAVGAPPVLADLFEIAGQHADDLVDLGAGVVPERVDGGCGRLLQLAEKLDRKVGEIIHEIERVFDLVRDPGGQLAQ